MQDIKTFTLSLPLNVGSVNCYLVETDTGYILFDTGGTNKRAELEEELERVGCRPDNLKLIALTHGDFDHTGNAAYLRHKFDTKVAMHVDDSGMVERGDMFWNRQQPNILIRMIFPVLFRLKKADRFKPDFYLDEGDDLTKYGLDTRVICIPGHSKGSIGFLLADGALIGGDLFTNTDKPALNSIMDNPTAANDSLERLQSLEINTVYPGHGQPFSIEQFIFDPFENNS